MSEDITILLHGQGALALAMHFDDVHELMTSGKDFVRLVDAASGETMAVQPKNVPMYRPARPEELAELAKARAERSGITLANTMPPQGPIGVNR